MSQVDLSKRYDVYCTGFGHYVLYEDVRFVGIRSIDCAPSLYSSFGNYQEIEGANGSRSLIPSIGIHSICEHGTPPMFKILRRGRNRRDY
jgi:hypothetical protein